MIYRQRLTKAGWAGVAAITAAPWFYIYNASLFLAGNTGVYRVKVPYIEAGVAITLMLLGLALVIVGREYHQTDD